jgi:long-subunit fatty acid transport protein
MRQTITAGAALVLTASTAHAVGLDRSGQPVGIIFEDGNYAELSYGNVSPSIDGNSVTTATSPIGNVANSYGQLGFGIKVDVSDRSSFALIVDEPYGADIEYPSDAAAPLGNTAAELDSRALTALLRYKFDDTYSVHGGIRAQRISGNVVLPAGGTTVDLNNSTAFGYTIGGAYERPEIGLRIALTYFSEVDHDFDTTTGGAFQEVLNVTTPQAVNLDFQTGIAKDTLLFGSIRWAEYSVVQVTPTPVGRSIVDVEDGFSYSLGVGHRFNERFSGSISVGLDTKGEDDLVSPLGPTNGSYSIGLGGQYKISDKVTLSGGVRYVVFGDVRAELSENPFAELEDNSAVAVGFKIGYNF